MADGNDKDQSLLSKAEQAFYQAAAKVILEAKLTGTPIIVWKDGRVAEISSEAAELELKRAS
jgi:hypothetical protein